MTTTQLVTKVEISDCCICGGPIALTETMQRILMNSHDTFYCPTGHGNCYSGKSEAEKLKEKLTEAQERANALSTKLATAEHFLDVGRQEAAKVKRRIHAGTCQECRRNFQNVARHMETQHSKGKE